jgi:hypothetical protein
MKGIGVFFVVTALLMRMQAQASGLTSGHYQFQVPYAPVALNGTYPITVGILSTRCSYSVRIDALGHLSGTADMRSYTGSMSGTFSAQGDIVSFQAQTSGQDPTQQPSTTQAQLSGRQFTGQSQNNNGTVAFAMDVSAAAPLLVSFALDLTVDAQGSVSGSGTAIGAGVQLPVSVTGTNTANSCSLHIIGTTLPQFTWNGSGPPIANGFIAAWNANGFGVTRSGASLPIFGPNTPGLTPYVVSRKVHGVNSAFDIGASSNGSPAVECRTGPTSGVHQLVVMFPKNVSLNPPVGTPAVRVSSGTGSVGQFLVSNNEIIIDLTGVADAQTIALTLSQVSDGTTTADVVVSMSFLRGDTNGNGAVNSTDVSQTKLQSGQAITNTNFRNDINLNGSINATDVSLVKAKTGTALP